MNIREMNKPLTSAALNETMAKKFGTKIDVDSFTLEQLQDARNKIRTKQFDIETNESFSGLSQNRTYSKNKLFLDVLNAAISERADIAEAAKPDFLDIDKDGDKKEPMKKAVQDKKKKKTDEGIKLVNPKSGKKIDITKPEGDAEYKKAKAAGDFDDEEVKEGDGIYHDCAKKFEHKVYGECTVIPGEHTLLEDGTVTHYDATFVKEGETYIVRNVAVKDMYNVISEGHTHASKSKRKKAKMESVIREGQDPVIQLLLKAYDDAMADRDMATAKIFTDELEKRGFKFDQLVSTPKKTYSIGNDPETGALVRQESIIREGEEDKAELVMAAKDMVDRLTGWMEDTAEMQTESMLELADAIRDEMGAQQSESFTNAVKPALEQLYAAMESTRVALTGGVGMLTGEGVAPAADMGAELPVEEPIPGAEGMEPTIDTDEFAAAAPAAGGEEEAGRERRESRNYAKKKMIETSRRLGSILSSR